EIYPKAKLVTVNESENNKENFAKKEDPSPSFKTQSLNWILPLSGVVLVIVVLVALKSLLSTFHTSTKPSPSSVSGSAELYRTFWESGERGAMREVARKAVFNGDALAMVTIIGEVLKNKETEGVNTDIIKLVFTSPESRYLTKEDKRVVLFFALADFFSKPPSDLEPLQKAHPLVLLALAVNVDCKKAGLLFPQATAQKLISLKNPLSLKIKVLAGLDKNLSPSEISAFLKFFLTPKKVTPTTFECYLKNASLALEQRGKILLLLDPLQKDQDLSKALYTWLLSSKHSLIKNLISWFETEEGKEIWQNAPFKTKLAIAGGVLPSAKLTVNQLLDLLLYPDSQIKEQSLKRLNQEYNIKGKIPLRVIKFLTFKKNSLSRPQITALLGIFLFQDKADSVLVSNWFKTKPNPSVVVKLLELRKDFKTSLDPFSIEAVRYLKETSWKPTLKELKSLALHKEKLVRALAYSRINIKDPSYKKVIKEIIEIEPDKNLKNLLKDLLNNEAY
ncbi:MAG: hypothetical protein D6780_05520, partial [Candidatus Dadabacteria bacterium]